jgi:hypothetical protein
MFNNCKYDYAPRNAREMAEVLGDVVAPRLGEPRDSNGEPVDGARSGDGAEGEGFSGRLF